MELRLIASRKETGVERARWLTARAEADQCHERRTALEFELSEARLDADAKRRDEQRAPRTPHPSPRAPQPLPPIARPPTARASRLSVKARMV